MMLLRQKKISKIQTVTEFDVSDCIHAIYETQGCNAQSAIISNSTASKAIDSDTFTPLAYLSQYHNAPILSQFDSTKLFLGNLLRNIRFSYGYFGWIVYLPKNYVYSTI